MEIHCTQRDGGARTTLLAEKKIGEAIMSLHICEGLAQQSEQPCLVQARRTELTLALDSGLSEGQRIRPNVRKKSSEHPLVFHRLLETAFLPLQILPSHTPHGSNMATFKVHCLPSSGHVTKPGQS